VLSHQSNCRPQGAYEGHFEQATTRHGQVRGGCVSAEPEEVRAGSVAL